MKDFLFNNWKFLICVVLAIAEILYLIFSKKIKVDSLKEEILRILPFAIFNAEKIFGAFSGEEKLQFCLDFIKKILNVSNDYDSFIISSIENILSTPEKKGIK